MGTLFAAGNQLGLLEVTGVIDDYLRGDGMSMVASAGGDVANENDLIGMGGPITLSELARLTTCGFPDQRDYNITFSLESRNPVPFGGFL